MNIVVTYDEISDYIKKKGSRQLVTSELFR